MKIFTSTFILLATLFLFTASVSLADTKQTTALATISSRDVLLKCDQGTHAIKDLEEKFAGKKRQLAEQEQEVLRVQKEAATPGAKPVKQQEFKSKQEKFQQDMQKFNQELRNAETESFKPIIERVRQILQDYSKEKGIVAIQERAQLVFADPSVDITEEIIKRANKK
jgi:Skp family chaperone for outer membrane proteins